MADVTTKAAHAKPALKDHLWVLAVIAGFALFDVWESWTQLGNKSGFAHGTGWTLTVIVEAYAGYALFAWFNTPGRRSRRFAMWSAFGVLGLSLIGQGSSTLAAHATPPLWLAVFVKDLPVVVLALIAILIHLRRLDRGEAAAAELAHAETAQEAAEEAAATDERTVLRAELDAQREASQAELETLRGELDAATIDRSRVEQDAADALAKVEALTQKLARVSGRKPARKSTPNKVSASTPNTGAGSTLEPEVPEDVDTQAEALRIIAQEPGISGSALGRRLGKSERYGCMLKKSLTRATAPVDPSGKE